MNFPKAQKQIRDLEEQKALSISILKITTDVEVAKEMETDIEEIENNIFYYNEMIEKNDFYEI